MLAIQPSCERLIPQGLHSHSDLVIGDGTCAQIRVLLDGSPRDTVFLGEEEDPLAVVSAALERRRNTGNCTDTLHLVVHGRPGAFLLGSRWVNAATLAARASLLASWQVGKIAIWGCHVGQDHAFLDIFAELTGAEIFSAESPLDNLNGWSLRSRRSIRSSTDCTTQPPPCSPFDPKRRDAWPYSLAFTVEPVAKEEGDSGSTEFDFIVRRTGDTEEFTFGYQVSSSKNPSADADDFVTEFNKTPPDTFTFPAGQSEVTIPILVQGDFDIEPDENFRLLLVDDSGLLAFGDGVIINDDFAIEPDPGIGIEKIADPTSLVVPGTVVYTYEVNNTGNVALEGITVTDDNGTPGIPGDDFDPTYQSGDTNSDGKLDLTETWIYTASVNFDADDLSRSPITNKATAASTTGNVNAFTQATVSLEAPPIEPDPGIGIEKIADPTSLVVPGTVVYTYEVNNTGNVALEGITVTDDNGTPGIPGDDFDPTYQSGDTNSDGKLDLTETWIYTASVNFDADDLSRSPITNKATAASTTGNVNAFTEATVSLEAPPIEPDPGIGIEKIADPTSLVVPGTVVYTYEVNNTGNVALEGITVTDDNGTPGIPGDDFDPTYQSGDTNSDGKLDLTETWIYTASVNFDADDLSRSPITNKATAASTTGNVNAFTQATVSLEAPPIEPDPGIGIEKIADPTSLVVPGTVVYTYEVNNTGNVALEGITVTDDNGTPGIPGDDFDPTYQSGDTNSDGKLDLTETWIYTASVNFDADDLSRSPITNKATAASTTGNVNAFTEATVSLEAPPIEPNPSLTIDKVTSDGINSGDGLTFTVGTPITWEYTIENNGNVTFNRINLDVTDNQPGVTPAFSEVISGDNDDLFEPGEIWLYTATGTAEAGPYTNIGTVLGEGGEGLPNASDTDASDYTGIESPDTEFAIRVEKSADPTIIPANVETEILYEYLIFNDNTGEAAGFPWLLDSLIDDDGTPGIPGDDFDLLEGFDFGEDYGNYYFEDTARGIGDFNANFLVDSDEIWGFRAVSFPTLAPGQSVTNTVEVVGVTEGPTRTDTDTATVRAQGGGTGPGGPGTGPLPPEVLLPSLVVTPDGRGVTVVGSAGQGLWVELSVIGAFAELQNSLNVLRVSGGASEEVGALGSSPIAPEVGVLGGKRYVFLASGEELRFTQSTGEQPLVADPSLIIDGSDPSIVLGLDDGAAGPDADFNDLEVLIRSVAYTPDADYAMGLPQASATDGFLDLTGEAADGIEVTLQSFSDLGNTLSFVKIDIDPVTGSFSVGGVTLDQGEAFRNAVAANLADFSVDLGGEGSSTTVFWDPAESGLYAPVLLTGYGDLLTIGPSGTADGLAHLKVLGQNSFAFEDLLASQGADWDFNDFLVTAQVA